MQGDLPCAFVRNGGEGRTSDRANCKMAIPLLRPRKKNVSRASLYQGDRTALCDARARPLASRYVEYAGYVCRGKMHLLRFHNISSARRVASFAARFLNSEHDLPVSYELERF